MGGGNVGRGRHKYVNAHPPEGSKPFGRVARVAGGAGGLADGGEGEHAGLD